MDNRLIFLYLLSIKVTDYPDVYVVTEVHVEPSLRAKRKQVSSPKKSKRSSPYRKPTQVVGMSILRRSSDSWLRN